VLAQDLGEAMGVGGFALALRRTRIGRFNVSEALPLEQLTPENYLTLSPGVLSLDQALASLPALELEEARSRLAANGNELRVSQEGRFRTYGQGRLLGVFEAKAGVARPLVMFPADA
jgi:tRNA pseudouridine55 synthase